jgi:YbbR domain-containing protein
VKAIWPFRHLGLKALSIGLAVLMWIVVARHETVERGLRVPLELQQFPSGLELQGEPPALVDVRVRGSSDDLSRVQAGDIVAVLDLHAARPGRRLFQLTPEHVRTPFGIDVAQVMPATLVLVFETSMTRRLPVVPAVEGDPAPGFVVGAVTPDPPTVDVVGPESAVKQATEALTDPVSVAGASADVIETVTVGFLDPALRVQAPSPRTARVQVQVLPGPRERILRDRPVRLRDLGPNLAAQALPPSVSVAVRGSREGLGRLTAEQVNPFVDLKGLGPGDYSLTVQIDAFPEGGVAGVEPPMVQVRLTSVQN